MASPGLAASPQLAGNQSFGEMLSASGSEVSDLEHSSKGGSPQSGGAANARGRPPVAPDGPRAAAAAAAAPQAGQPGGNWAEPNSTIYCGRCGTLNWEEHSFCQRCGARIRPPPQQAAVRRTASQDQGSPLPNGVPALPPLPTSPNAQQIAYFQAPVGAQPGSCSAHGSMINMTGPLTDGSRDHVRMRFESEPDIGTEPLEQVMRSGTERTRRSSAATTSQQRPPPTRRESRACFLRAVLQAVGCDAAFWCHLLKVDDSDKCSDSPDRQLSGLGHASFRLSKRNVLGRLTPTNRDRQCAAQRPSVSGGAWSLVKRVSLALAGAHHMRHSTARRRSSVAENEQLGASAKAPTPPSQPSPIPGMIPPPIHQGLQIAIPSSDVLSTGHESRPGASPTTPSETRTPAIGDQPFRDPMEQGWREDALETVLLSRDGYDLTPDRLNTVFLRHDKQARSIGGEHLAQALQFMGVGLPPHKWKQLTTKLGKEPLNLDEFCCVVTKLKLAELCTGPYWPSDNFDTPSTDECFAVDTWNGAAVHPLHREQQREQALQALRSWTPLWVVDYDTGESEKEPVVIKLSSRETIRDFLFGHREDDQSMRWVHLDQPEHVMLLRVTVKYHLHPLAVDDALAKKGTKFDRYGPHFAFSCDVIQLVLLDDESPGGAPVQTCTSHVCCFFAGRAGYRATVLTASSLHEENGDQKPYYDIWEELIAQIKEPHTRMREHRGDYLVYKVLSRVVDELRLVTAAYRRRLAHLQKMVIHLDPYSSRQNQPLLLEVSEIDLHVTDLQRSVRPMRQLVSHIISGGEECVSADVKMYCQDTHGALMEVADDLAQVHSMCKTADEQWQHLVDQSARDSDRQLNDMLSVLTIATTAMAPLQFLCGVYGMNFVHSDGSPSIPELRWDQGYLYFWSVCLGWMTVAGVGASCYFYRRNTKSKQAEQPAHIAQHGFGAFGQRPMSAPRAASPPPD